MLWISGIKPFECVGTNEEMVYSMYKALNNYTDDQAPYILKIFQEEVLPSLQHSDIQALEKKLLSVYETDRIPVEIKDQVPLFSKN